MLDAGIRRGTILTVAVLMVCVLGIVAALRIPVQMIPDLEVPRCGYYRVMRPDLFDAD